jgi:cation:H+ antiporter
MIWMSAAMVVGGLVLLAFAADRFVLAAARLARAWGVSTVLIGALIVGMGTSAPELLVSVLAGIAGERDLALGNAVGSNVANVTLVIGTMAVLAPFAGNMRVLRREGVMMLIAVIGFAWALFDLEITRIEGIVLMSSMLVAGLLIVRWAKQDADAGQEIAGVDEDAELISWKYEAFVGVIALGATLLGAELLVRGGVEIAHTLGVGSAFVGMTLVAIGTSLPELATGIAGIRRSEHDIVLGNVLGSNLFNALAVGGMAGILAPGPLDPSFDIASIAMVIAAVLAGLLAFTGRMLVRWEGIVLLLGFAAFIWLTYS